MKKPLFTGVCTALVTPFLNGNINYPMVEQLLRHQMESGIRAVVLAGTTGEAPTLSDEEKLELFRRGKTFVRDRCLIIAGTGSNSTSHAVELSIAAEEAGADALLVVTPYYNKGSEEGILAHYARIAHSVRIPVIIYNVPSRTGIDMAVSLYKRLSIIPNIAGVKEASADITKIAKIRAVCPATFQIWTGNDDQTVPVMALGGDGVISVISNVCPKETVAMADAALSGDYHTAAALQQHLLPTIELLFSEVNPIPVKAAMKCIGFDCGEYRLPLTAPKPDIMARIQEFFQ